MGKQATHVPIIFSWTVAMKKAAALHFIGFYMTLHFTYDGATTDRDFLRSFADF